MSLTKKIILMVLVIVIASLVGSGWVSFIKTEKLVQDMIIDQQMLRTSQLMRQVDQFLNERYYDINIFSSSYQAAVILKHQATADDDEEWIGEKAVKSGMWKEMSLVDNDGVIKWSTEQELEGTIITSTSIKGRSFNQAKNGLIVYTDAVVIDQNGEVGVVFSAPVWGELNGEKLLLGVVQGNISWPMVEEFLLAEPSHAILMNSKGEVIAQNFQHDDQQYIGENLKEKEASQHIFKATEHGALTKSVSSEFDSLTTHVSEKGDVDYRGNGWILLMETPADQAFHQSRNQAVSMMLVILPIISAGGILIIWIVINLLMKPLSRITKVSEKFSQGNLSVRVQVKSKDEIGVLGQTFNTMAKELEKKHADLEEQVSQKTHELAKKVAEGIVTNDELEKMNRFMVGRELKMVELKKQLAEKQGETK